MKTLLNCMTMLVVLGAILTFVGFIDGVKHQDFSRGLSMLVKLKIVCDT